MPKGSYGLSPNQQHNQRKPLDAIMAEADALPKPVQKRSADDMQPLVIKLRDDKGLGWSEIAGWMRDHTEFYRSGTFWKNIYSGKRVGIIRNERKLTPTLQQPTQPQLNQNT